MEEKILHELSLIKWMLVAIFIAVVIPVALIILNRIFGFRLKFQSRTDSFIHICGQKFEDGDYYGLKQYCKSEIEKRPNSANAYYWLARAYQSEKNYTKAREQFLKSAELEPSWLKDSIKPHLDNMPNES